MTVQHLSADRIQHLLGDLPLAAPAYRDLAERLRLLVVDGRLPAEVRLPAERELARALGVSRATVTAGYARLAEAGFLRSRQGSGAFVRLPVGVGRSGPGSVVDPTGVITLAFASGAAAPGVAEAYRGALDRLAGAFAGPGYLPTGLPELRQAVAAWYERRGLPTDPEQVVVTNGAQSALTVVARTLIGPGDRVLLESPTYPNALDAFRRAGARPVALPLSGAAWPVADLQHVLRQTAPAVAYLIPDFHNPTGLSLPGDQRAAVARALRRHRTTAVIDESLVEVALDGTPAPPPLARHLPDAITVGSASKAYWGGLRIGWIRAPRDLVPALVETRALQDLGSPVLEQLVVADLLERSEQVLAPHLERLRVQRDALLAALAEALPTWRPNQPAGGLSLWVRLPAEASSRLAAAAERVGVVVTAGPRFFVAGGGERHLRLPYSATPEVLAEAVSRLAQAWSSLGAPEAEEPTGRLRLLA